MKKVITLLLAAGLVIGAWPAAPGVAETCNRTDLTRLTGVPVLAVIPDGAGAQPPQTIPPPAHTRFGEVLGVVAPPVLK